MQNQSPNNELEQKICPIEEALKKGPIEQVYFEGLSHYLDKLELMPSSSRYFNSVYEIGITILSLLGKPELKGRGINVAMLAETENAVNLWYMKYSKPFASPIDSFLIEHISDNGKTAIDLQRKRGHLALQEEIKKNYDLIDKYTRRLTDSEHRKGLREMQPYRVYKGTSETNLKLAHEF